MTVGWPSYREPGIDIYHGDCRLIASILEPVDVVIADPPYGETSLSWDKTAEGWLVPIDGILKQSGSLWCFGSFRFFMNSAGHFAGWRSVQEIVWEKHNGSSSHADRFRRVHEIVAQFVRQEQRWADVYKQPVYTHDATARTVRRKERPPHWGEIKNSTYQSHDGGPRLMRSVIKMRSCHGHAVHPTQKPVGLIRALLEYSCPAGGTVLDPFMGSGSTLLAARDLGLNAIGIELRREYCDAAAERLRQTVLPLANGG